MDMVLSTAVMLHRVGTSFLALLMPRVPVLKARCILDTRTPLL